MKVCLHLFSGSGKERKSLLVMIEVLVEGDIYLQ